jgi:hypothetical protein
LTLGAGPRARTRPTCSGRGLYDGRPEAHGPGSDQHFYLGKSAGGLTPRQGSTSSGSGSAWAIFVAPDQPEARAPRALVGDRFALGKPPKPSSGHEPIASHHVSRNFSLGCAFGGTRGVAMMRASDKQEMVAGPLATVLSILPVPTRPKRSVTFNPNSTLEFS